MFAVSVNAPSSGVVLHDYAYGEGKQVLYPGFDPCIFDLIQTTVKDLQYYVKNPTSLQEQSPTVIYEDDSSVLRVGMQITAAQLSSTFPRF